MTVRESDPTRRAELHAARATLMGVDHLLNFARQQAASGGRGDIRSKILRGQGELDKAMTALVEALATNGPEDPS